MKLLQNKYKILFEGIVGSQAYGLGTPESDQDIKGVFIQSNEDILSNRYIPQIDVDSDTVYYELRRFLELVSVGNPNVLELLFLPERCKISWSKEWEYLLNIREEFLSKKCYYTFSGYAKTQLNKAKGLNKKFNWEAKRIERKDIIDFSKIIDRETGKTFLVKEWLKNNNYTQEHVGLTSIDGFRDCYKLYTDDIKWASDNHRFDNIDFTNREYKGIGNKNTNEPKKSAIEKYMINKWKGIMYFNREAYSNHCKEYKQYQKWLRNRNKNRVATNKKHGQQYDCYLDKNTEYLTDSGFKKYDEISENDLIGTVNPETFNLEYEKYVDRFKDKYTGKILEFKGRYHKIQVTPNHKLYVSKTYRNGFTGFKPYSDLGSNWKFITAEDYKNQSGESYYLNKCRPKGKGVKYPITWWFLAGDYLGDGHITMTKDKTRPRLITISKSDSKPLSKYLDRLAVKKYFSKRTKNCDNYIYTFDDRYGKGFLDFIYNNFGTGSHNKFANLDLFLNCSAKEIRAFKKGLIMSDGTKHSCGKGEIYYSANQKLIEDLQLIFYINGVNSQSYFYYDRKNSYKDHDAHHLFFPEQKDSEFKILYKNKSAYKEIDVEDEYVSCFTVPNGLLITKNDGKISIQGNSKNLLHVVRLIMTAKEIPLHNTINVDRSKDRDFLLSIKRGEVNLKTIIDEWSEEADNLNKLYENSLLKDEVDLDFIRNIELKIRNNEL